MAQVRTIQHNESLDQIWEELVYTEARFLGDPLTKDLAAAHAALLTQHESVRAGQRAVWRGEITAQAAVDAANARLDTTTGAFGAKLLGIVSGRRDHPRFKRYLPEGVYAVQKLALARQVERIRTWPESLRGEPEGELQAFAAQFEARIAEGTAALQARAQAEAARADQRVREIIPFIDDVNAARLSALGRLLQRTVKHDLERDWAEGFFRRGARRARAVEAEDVPVDGGGGDQGG